MSAYLELTSDVAGVIPGNVVDPKGYEGWILVNSLSFAYRKPMDGMRVSGRTQAEVARFSCPGGRHAVLIWRALAQNENLTARIVYDESDDGDQPETEFNLKNCRCVSVGVNVAGGPMGGSSQISFDLTYETAGIKDVETGDEHEDTVAREAGAG